MRSITRAATIAGLTLATAVLPFTATAATTAAQSQQAVTAPAGQVAVADIIKTCGKGYSGYIRRPGKDALCLRPGTRTWGGFKAFECRGKLTVYFKEGQKVECGGYGVNFPDYGGVVKTVAR